MSVITLDEVVSLFVQLEPDDHEGLKEFRRLVWGMLPSAPPPLRPVLASVLVVLDEEKDAASIVTLERINGVLTRATEPVAPEPVASGSTRKAKGKRPSTKSAGPNAPTAPVAPPAAARMLLLPDDADASLLGDFLSESREYLANAETALLLLESNPDDVEAINVVFRAFHTVKGTAAMLGLGEIAELAHHAETLLTRVRNREIACTGGYADLALRSGDALSSLLDAHAIALTGAPAPLPDHAAFLAVLANPEAAGVTEATSTPVHAPAAAPAGSPAATGVSASRVERRDADADAMLRVRTARVDQLIEMVGELVIAMAMVTQDDTVRQGAHHALQRKVNHAAKITRELQDVSMGMRMVPLRGPFQRMARLVRDVAAKCGKSVAFHAMGEETEIDRNLVDLIADPLVHMVRNAVDHGIETPMDRLAAGKPAEGSVRLSAYHAGGHVVVELTDDGRGLSRERLLQKAAQMGLVEPGATLSDSEVFQLIFAPGFSTAEQVTDVSGRGVGMDVVRRNVEAVRGRIEIASAPGAGTTFIVRLPLTLAITDGMLVRVGTERYIIPTAHIQMSLRPDASALATYQHRAEMLQHREMLLPIVRLHRLFNTAGAVADPTQGLLVIVGEGRSQTALLVDELLGQQQVVAKSLGDALGRVAGIAGSAILGDGRVGLILDVSELVALSRQVPGDDALRAHRSREVCGERPDLPMLSGVAVDACAAGVLQAAASHPIPTSA